MTNIDPGGILVLLTVIPAVVAGAVSITLAHVAARLGYGTYERNVWAILGILVAIWILASLVVSTAMLQILAVSLSMLGAYATTRDRSDTSYGWVLGVVLLYVGFAILAWTGLYAGVDRTGQPQGLIARNLIAFYYGGLFAGGALGGAIVAFLRGWNSW